MQENDKPVLVYSTFPSAEAAETIGRELVEQRLAACVNILPAMTSIYRWEGAITRDAEAVMLIKTRRSRATRVMDAVRARHSYENPALLVLEVAGGAPDYLRWLLEGTAGPGPDSGETDPYA